MKRLKIEVRRSTERRLKQPYSIFFSNGYVMKFSSKRKAEDYMRVFASNVTDIIRSQLNLYIRLNSLYLSHYFEIKPSYCIRIERKTDYFQRKLSFCFREYGKGNSSISVDSVWVLFNSLEDGSKELRRWAIEYKKYNVINECNSFIQLHSLLECKFNDIMSETCASKDYKRSELKIAYKSLEFLS